MHKLFGARFSVAMVAMVVLSGCASLGGGQTPEGEVRKLAQARWDAHVAGDFEKVYNFISPSYRELVDYRRYRAGIGSSASVVSAEVVDVKCDPGGCITKTRLEFVHALMTQENKGSTHFDERWINEGGKWWLYQR